MTFKTGETSKSFTFTTTQDAIDDDAESVKLSFGSTLPDRVSRGSPYETTLTIGDDDTAALVLSETSLTVVESVTTGATYTVKLATQPTATVTVTVSGQANTDLTLTGLSTTNTLTFTTDNWNMPKTVTVKAAQDEDAADDTATLAHTAADGGYASVTKDLPVTVTDVHTAALVLNKTALSVGEGNTSGETYTVKLSHVPTQTVTVTLSGHADTDLTLSGLSDNNTLTFTSANWNTPKTVTVKAGPDDDARNDAATLTHTAAGGEYASVKADLPVIVTDDETAGVSIDPTAIAVRARSMNRYSLVLDSEPAGDVTVTVSGHADTDLTLSGLSDTNTLTFTPDDWDTEQTVTVKAGPDDDARNDAATLTHTAAGGEYASVKADLPVIVTDDETAGVSIDPTAIAVRARSMNRYSLVLDSEPAGDVTVTVSGHADTDLTLSGLSDTNTLTFTPDDWDTEQTATVSAASGASAGDGDPGPRGEQHGRRGLQRRDGRGRDGDGPGGRGRQAHGAAWGDDDQAEADGDRGWEQHLFRGAESPAQRQT